MKNNKTKDIQHFDLLLATIACLVILVAISFFNKTFGFNSSVDKRPVTATTTLKIIQFMPKQDESMK